MALSRKPPREAGDDAIAVPNMTVRSAAVSAMVSESVVPSMRRERTSRPVVGSTPSGWLQLMPPPAPVGMPPLV